jgi:hypothetical protein
MSTVPSTSTSHSSFASIFNAALESHQRKTKEDLASHPLLPSLQTCDSPEAVLTVFRDQVPAFSDSQNCDDGLTTWVTPTVNVLHTFSETIGQGVGLVNIKTFRRGNFCPKYFILQAFPPASVIFAGIGVLLSVSVLRPPCVTYFDSEPRRLRMRELAKTSLSTSLTALNIFSAGSRYILSSHRLGL